MIPQPAINGHPVAERQPRPRLEPEKTASSPLAIASRMEPAVTDGKAVQVAELSPELHTHWQAYVQQSADATVFHDLPWMTAVARGYGQRPHYIVAQETDSGKIRGVLPLFEVSGPFTGRALVSVPFGVYGGLAADSDTASTALLERAKQLADECNARYVELRARGQGEGFDTRSHYYTFRCRLPENAKDVLSRYPRKSRAAIRQAVDKFGLRTEFGPGLLGQFRRLYLRSLRRLGSPPHSGRFFRELAAAFGDRCLVQVVYRDTEPVAGCISLVFKNQILPYFAGIDDRYSRLNTSNYMYFALMEHAVGLGLEVFDFGRTRRDNEGGCQFKINQGFEPEPLDYAFYVRKGALPDLRPSNPKFSLAQAVWRRLPLTAVSLLGKILMPWLP